MPLYGLISSSMRPFRYISLYLQPLIAMYVTASVVSIEDMYQGNKLKGVEILLEIPNIGVNTCAAECLAYVDCLSVNYDMESYVCELNTEISDDIDEKKDKYIHATKLQLQTNPKVRDRWFKIVSLR